MEYEYNAKSQIEFGQFNSSSLIYTMNVYVGNKFEYITRNYIKIQDIIGIISGLYRVILICFRIFNNYFNKMFKITKLMKIFFIIENKFEYNNNNIKILNDNLSDKNKNIFYKNNSIFNYSNNKLKSSLTSNHKLIKNYDNFLINQNITKRNENKNFISKIKTKKIIKFNSLKNYNNKNIPKLKSSQNQYKINKNQNENYYYFTFSNLLHLNLQNFFKTYFCCKNKKFQINKYFYLLSLGNKYLIEICELLYYFQTIKDIFYLKHFFLNESQYFTLNYIKQINLTNKSFFRYLNINDDYLIKEKIINYYVNNFINKKNSKLDKYIYQILDINMKNNIKEKLEKIK